MDVKVIIRGLWDRIGGWFLIGAGGLLLVLGWFGVSDTVLPSEQIPYVVSGGLGGIACIGIGATLLLSADLRDEWRKLDDVEELLRAATEHRTEAPIIAPILDTDGGGGAVADRRSKSTRRSVADAGDGAVANRPLSSTKR